MTGLCAVTGCEAPVKTRGYCSMHYTRWFRHGDPLVNLRDRDPAERFMEKVEQDAHTGCWVWMGAKRRRYGTLTVNGESVLAHRWWYAHERGAIPAGLELDHLCGNPPCVNPDHLEPVTRSENIRRWVETMPRQTHCRRGHEFSHVDRQGHSVCRACRNERQQIRRAAIERGERSER